MVHSGENPVDILDVRRIRRLVELMKDHDLSEIELRHGEQQIRLRKGHDPVVVSGDRGASISEVQPAIPSAVQMPPAPIPKQSEDRSLYITSPMVGTFYAAPNPEAAPFVNVGDRIGPDTVTCIIEAMKVFNEIQAECSGMIVAVLVENGAPVEFGQKLFKVVQEV
ncbi:MAG: acetyl-CoA carboxylase biotin carboxyl carrier protein [Pirellulales bacterium]|nr:acetyl-CoA carboxylase biotin carboxyl carrier protein [Pirellulales bacterium]